MIETIHTADHSKLVKPFLFFLTNEEDSTAETAQREKALKGYHPSELIGESSSGQLPTV